ncbi:hypothetical protein K469DRAFT_687847 [Zopfia rhizophila CBS 207.26]|uniref:Uncharacterized protein n=1 Tax=Zopfia rhizophila CBS 207.26 TaxID=1314779 RepID=A0A6A6E2S6_9PEZI|nr:hypothetical protein K469DRAFT_687847 [Zopfia rhizophila CBS 207.26]
MSHNGKPALAERTLLEEDAPLVRDSHPNTVRVAPEHGGWNNRLRERLPIDDGTLENVEDDFPETGPGSAAIQRSDNSKTGDHHPQDDWIGTKEGRATSYEQGHDSQPIPLDSNKEIQSGRTDSSTSSPKRASTTKEAFKLPFTMQRLNSTTTLTGMIHDVLEGCEPGTEHTRDYIKRTQFKRAVRNLGCHGSRIVGSIAYHRHILDQCIPRKKSVSLLLHDHAVDNSQGCSCNDTCRKRAKQETHKAAANKMLRKSQRIQQRILQGKSRIGDDNPIQTDPEYNIVENLSGCLDSGNESNYTPGHSGSGVESDYSTDHIFQEDENDDKVLYGKITKRNVQLVDSTMASAPTEEIPTSVPSYSKVIPHCFATPTTTSARISSQELRAVNPSRTQAFTHKRKCAQEFATSDPSGERPKKQAKGTYIPRPTRLGRFAKRANEKENCSPSKTRVMAYGMLPEVQQFAAIMKTLYGDFCLTKLRVVALDKDLNLGSHSTLVKASHDAVLRKLDMIEMLSRQVHSEIS